jgi:hypothetical protein
MVVIYVDKFCIQCFGNYYGCLNVYICMNEKINITFGDQLSEMEKAARKLLKMSLPIFCEP